MSRVNLKAKDLVVVKVGTSTLVKNDGSLNNANIEDLVRQLAAIKAKGFDVLLVSSGAVGFGKGILQMNGKMSIAKKQAAAAVGQVALMDAYTRLFAPYEINVGQMLLVNDDFVVRSRALNAKNTFEAMRALDIVAIVNENDSTVVDEIKIGDNDNLSALVSILLDASLLILLSDIDGLYSANPAKNPTAKRYEIISKIDNELMKVATGAGSALGTGGMMTKLEAAFKSTNSGIPMVIANGSDDNILIDIVEDHFNGTYFTPLNSKKNLRKKWLGFIAKTSGTIFIDEGAKDALLNKQASLLVPGVTNFVGEFEKDSIVAIYDQDHNLLAKGKATLSESELTNATSGIFIHKDNISLIEE
ncbi:glutamate 5-kinase [Mycoplasma sp. P36-A1]|uniref:glutamate 5-kinase n=1 Tax=Mycoplasma sp. P36-A1 TaxID=3252900 RepID=UPI003C2FEC80